MKVSVINALIKSQGRYHFPTKTYNFDINDRDGQPFLELVARFWDQDEDEEVNDDDLSYLKNFLANRWERIKQDKSLRTSYFEVSLLPFDRFCIHLATKIVEDIAATSIESKRSAPSTIWELLTPGVQNAAKFLNIPRTKLTISDDGKFLISAAQVNKGKYKKQGGAQHLKLQLDQQTKQRQTHREKQEIEEVKKGVVDEIKKITQENQQIGGGNYCGVYINAEDFSSEAKEAQESILRAKKALKDIQEISYEMEISEIHEEYLKAFYELLRLRDFKKIDELKGHVEETAFALEAAASEDAADTESPEAKGSLEQTLDQLLQEARLDCCRCALATLDGQIRRNPSGLFEQDAEMYVYKPSCELLNTLIEQKSDQINLLTNAVFKAAAVVQRPDKTQLQKNEQAVNEAWANWRRAAWIFTSVVFIVLSVISIVSTFGASTPVVGALAVAAFAGAKAAVGFTVAAAATYTAGAALEYSQTKPTNKLPASQFDKATPAKFSMFSRRWRVEGEAAEEPKTEQTFEPR